METTDAERVRPKPHQIMQKVFHLNQIVDAFFALEIEISEKSSYIWWIKGASGLGWWEMV